MQSVGTAVTQQGGVFVECPVGGSTGPAREGKLFGLVGGARDDCQPRDADPRANVPAHRTCRRTWRRRNDEARRQPAALGVLAGAGRSPDHLRAAQAGSRSADRYPVRHRRHADRDEGAWCRHRQGIERAASRRNRVRHQRREKGPGDGGAIRRLHGSAVFRWRQARSPASRKPMRPGLASRCHHDLGPVAASETPPNRTSEHTINRQRKCIQ